MKTLAFAFKLIFPYQMFTDTGSYHIKKQLHSARQDSTLYRKK